MMKTILVVLGMTAVLCSGILPPAPPSPSPSPSSCPDCGEWGHCNMTTSMCECYPGYTGTPCEDINECELSYGICGPPEINQCINQNGTYTCNCSMEYGFYYDPYNRTCTRDLPVELDATIIDDRDGCYSGDIYHYIENVKNETLDILREIIYRLDFHSEN